MILRAGIIGLGVGERHIAGYQACPGCFIAAICDRDEAKLAEVASRHPSLHHTTNPDSILKDPDINIVSIASWDDAHAEQIIQAIENGKHVFAEKPLCLHRKELQRIRAALDAHPDVRLSSNLVLRLSPRFKALHARVRQGTFGKLYYMEADYNYGRVHKIINGWRGRIPYYSVFLGGAVHLVDMLLWLTGWKVTEVVARGNNIATCETPFRFNDLTVALLTFENGAIAKVTANFACVTPHFHRLMLYGTNATFEHLPQHGRITLSRSDADTGERLDLPYPGVEKGDLLTAFVRHVCGTNSSSEEVVTHEDVFAAMSVCLAVEESINSGQAVPVPYY